MNTLQNASEYVMLGIAGFIKDPPDSDHQRGYLAALIVVATEGLGVSRQRSEIRQAESLLR